MSDQYVKHYVKVGERFTARMPYSEVCMFMLIADKTMECELLNGGWMVQLYTPDDHQPFSFPITRGEAGVFKDNDERLYVVKHDDDVKAEAGRGWGALLGQVCGRH